MIQSAKHYVQQTITPVAVGVNTNITVAVAVEVSGVNSSIEVREGALVKAVYVEMWVIGQSDTASGNCLISVYKNPGGSNNMGAADHPALHDYTNKKNVFYHTQGIINDGVANATPFPRGWIKIPKGKQRMGLGDKIQIAIMTQAEALNFCGFQTYKEYF